MIGAKIITFKQRLHIIRNVFIFDIETLMDSD